MVDKNETSNLRQCQSFVNKMIVVLFQISARAWPSKTMYCKEAQLVVEWSFHNEPSRLINGLVGHSKLTELNGLVIHHELIELINEFVHHSELNVGHIKFFRLCRMIVGSSSEGAKIVTIFPSSEGARRATSKLVVESTIVFKLAGVCPACIIFCDKHHKLIGEHLIASNYVAPSILWLIVENILPGAHVIPNISCEEPHRLIVTSNAPPNFGQELA